MRVHIVKETSKTSAAKRFFFSVL